MTKAAVISVFGALSMASSLGVLLWPTSSGFGRGAAVAPGRPHPAASRLGSRLAARWLTEPGGQRPSVRLAALAMGWATVVGLLLVALPLGLAVLAAAAGLRRFGRQRRAARDRRSLDEALPESIDLCIVVLGAGGTIRDCLDALALHGPPRIRHLVAAATERADGPQRLDEALRWLQHDLGPGFQPLTGALLLAREQGGSVGALLARLAVEASASRRRLGEVAARRLPVVLLIPLVTCSLPAVIVGTVIPLALVALSGIDH